MTGIFVRAFRRGRWTEVEVEELDEEEFLILADQQFTAQAGWAWAASLHRALRDLLAAGRPAPDAAPTTPARPGCGGAGGPDGWDGGILDGGD